MVNTNHLQTLRFQLCNGSSLAFKVSARHLALYDISNSTQQLTEAERVLGELRACKDALLVSAKACQELFNELDTAIKPERELRAGLHDNKQIIKKIKANAHTATPTNTAKTRATTATHPKR